MLLNLVASMTSSSFFFFFFSFIFFSYTYIFILLFTSWTESPEAAIHPRGSGTPAGEVSRGARVIYR